MANENELKILFTAETGEVKSESDSAAASVKKFGEVAAKAGTQAAQGFDKLKKSVQGVPQAFDEVAAGKAAMDRISKSIDAAVDSALRAGKGFDQMGAKVPLQDMSKLRESVAQLKRDLSSGFGSRITIVPRDTPELINNTAASLGKLRNASGSANLALNDVSRILQDLPYGFIGIQNNLNPMLESFRRLKTETGSTSGAFKALAGSIGGFGGLGLALAAASSALVIFQNGISGFNRKTKEAKKDTKDLADSLRSVSDVQKSAGANVEAEINKVRTLANVILDTNKAYEVRKRGIEELKNVNKGYFGDLELETSALSKLTGKVNEYTEALLNNAITNEFASEIAKGNVNLVKQRNLLEEIRAEFNKSVQAQGQLNAPLEKNAAGFLQLPKNLEQLRKQASLLDENREKLSAQKLVVYEAEDSLQLLDKAYDQAIEAGLGFKAVTGKITEEKKKEVDVLQKEIDKYEDLQKVAGLLYVEEKKLADLRAQKIRRDDKEAKVDPGLTERKVNAVLQPYLPDPGSLKGTLDELFTDAMRGKFVEMKIPVNVTAIPKSASVAGELGGNLSNDFNKSITDTLERRGAEDGKAYIDALKAGLGKSIAETLSGAIGDAFAAVGESLGVLLSGQGGFAAAAEGFLSFIGSIMQEIGKQIIKASAAMEAVSKAIKAMFANPATGGAGGILAGIALVAAGTILKNLKFNVPKFATGGMVMGPTLGLVGEAGPEMIIPLNRAHQFLDNGAQQLEGEFALRGHDLLLAVQRANTARGRSGGPRLNF